MRELKQYRDRSFAVSLSRTPPGVRELKLLLLLVLLVELGRTPPGVRELKPDCENA